MDIYDPEEKLQLLANVSRPEVRRVIPESPDTPKFKLEPESPRSNLLCKTTVRINQSIYRYKSVLCCLDKLWPNASVQRGETAKLPGLRGLSTAQAAAGEERANVRARARATASEAPSE